MGGRWTSTPIWMDKQMDKHGEVIKEIFSFPMFVGPASGLPAKHNCYHGYSDSTKLESMGSISAPSTHCTSASKKTQKETFQTKDE